MFNKYTCSQVFRRTRRDLQLFLFTVAPQRLTAGFVRITMGYLLASYLAFIKFEVTMINISVAFLSIVTNVELTIASVEVDFVWCFGVSKNNPDRGSRLSSVDN